MSTEVKLNISGMTCNHCVAKATKALEAVAGVETVEVTLEPGGATVTGTVAASALAEAVNQAGYTATVV